MWIKFKVQNSKFKILIIISLLTLYFTLLISTAKAVVDPLSVPNNKFGIHLIQATPDESSPAASLVNSSGGDWGYITVLIEGKDKKKDKWQEFFNDLRKRHLIPIVRLATIPDGAFWKRPDIGEASVWADFLDSLNWPTKNRYVTIYNEPNHAQEWGNSVDARNYAKVLDQTITALKSKSEDFFVLNAGLDASTPNQPPNYLDELTFLQQMEEEVPGIFNKLDGWVSHSYPNPAFAGSPYAVGKGTIRTYRWEIQQLKNLGLTKNLPIFITETGWKHAEGLDYDFSLPTAQTVAENYKIAFESAWNDPSIVAVTPFLLNYQEKPFDHFSFKKIQNTKSIDIASNNSHPKSNEDIFYPQYKTILDLPKIVGKPKQKTLAQLTAGEVYSSLVAGENYQITLTFKNIGQSIWNDSSTDSDLVKLVAIEGGSQLGIENTTLPKSVKVEPNQEHSFKINLKAPQKGSFKVKLNLFTGNTEFDSKPLEFTTEVKQPVILKTSTKLKWKNNSSGEYILKVGGATGDTKQKITLDAEGNSKDLEARYLLPDYSFDFTLEKPFYHSKTIRQTLKTGINTLDFGTLEPKLFAAILNPSELWKLLPWSTPIESESK